MCLYFHIFLVKMSTCKRFQHLGLLVWIGQNKSSRTDNKASNSQFSSGKDVIMKTQHFSFLMKTSTSVNAFYKEFADSELQKWQLLNRSTQSKVVNQRNQSSATYLTADTDVEYTLNLPQRKYLLILVSLIYFHPLSNSYISQSVISLLCSSNKVLKLPSV